jgi:hypothetical protein
MISGAEDEISFDPDDIITNVEMVSCFMSVFFFIKFSVMFI